MVSAAGGDTKLETPTTSGPFVNAEDTGNSSSTEERAACRENNGGVSGLRPADMERRASSADIAEHDEETLFESVGNVMKSLNTWISNNADCEVRKSSVNADAASSSSSSAGGKRKSAVTKTKPQSSNDATRENIDSVPLCAIGKMPSGGGKKVGGGAGARKRKSTAVDSPGEKVQNADRSEQASHNFATPEKCTKRSKKKVKRDDDKGANEEECATVKTACTQKAAKKEASKRPHSSAEVTTESVEPLAKSKSSKCANNRESEGKATGIPTEQQTDAQPKRRTIRLQRCSESKVAQFDVCDNRPPKKRPAVALLKLFVRALQPRALLPGESCVLSGNVCCDQTTMHGVEMSAYGDEMNLHISSAGSLLDSSVGGLSLHVVNISPSFYQLNVGDVIGYIQFRSLDGSLRLNVQ